VLPYVDGSMDCKSSEEHPFDWVLYVAVVSNQVHVTDGRCIITMMVGFITRADASL
jgi:hypothetical protein